MQRHAAKFCWYDTIHAFRNTELIVSVAADPKIPASDDDIILAPTVRRDEIFFPGIRVLRWLE
jgi:hypothetical protein